MSSVDGNLASNAKPIRWGILGTGNIAKTLAKAINASETGDLLAVGSRSQESADRFGTEFGIERRYDSYDGVLNDPDVQAVYISLPNHLHKEWTIRAAVAGKQILLYKQGVVEPEEFIVDAGGRGPYTVEADLLAGYVRAGRVEATTPALSWADTLGNQAALDRWRAEIGLVFDVER